MQFSKNAFQSTSMHGNVVRLSQYPCSLTWYKAIGVLGFKVQNYIPVQSRCARIKAADIAATLEHTKSPYTNITIARYNVQSSFAVVGDSCYDDDCSQEEYDHSPSAVCVCVSVCACVHACVCTHMRDE